VVWGAWIKIQAVFRFLITASLLVMDEFSTGKRSFQQAERLHEAELTANLRKSQKHSACKELKSTVL